TGLDEPHRDLRLERPVRVRHLVERDGERGFAVVIGLRQVFERRLLAADAVIVVVDAEIEPREARPLARSLDLHLAFEIEAGGWRAIEEAAVDGHFSRRLLG